MCVEISQRLFSNRKTRSYLVQAYTIENDQKSFTIKNVSNITYYPVIICFCIIISENHFFVHVEFFLIKNNLV